MTNATQSDSLLFSAGVTKNFFQYKLFQKHAQRDESSGRLAALEICLIRNKPVSVFRISHEVFIKGADPLLAEHHLEKREEFSLKFAPAFHLQGMMQ